MKNLIDPLGANSGCLFFKKNMASSVTRFHGQLSSCTISGKTYDPILRNFSNAWADKRMDRQTDQKTVRLTRIIAWDAVQLTSSIQKK